MGLLKGDGTGTLEGLFLAACHYETFQLSGEQRQQPGSFAFYGSNLAVLQEQPRE
jgi:hypothetical protein